MTDKTPPATGAAEPSMEDILASIRRILNEDDTSAPAAEASDHSPADEDVLVLDRSMMVSGAEPASPLKAEPEQPLEPGVTPMAMAEPVKPAAEARDQEPAAEARHQETEVVLPPLQAEPVSHAVPSSDLIAPEAAAAAASSVDSLVRTLTAERATQVYSGGPTLEEIVRAELRPLLKDWLNNNLPPVVERLVRAEIERVVGRAVP